MGHGRRDGCVLRRYDCASLSEWCHTIWCVKLQKTFLLAIADFYVGWSFGGVVAFEAAKQLLTAGFSVRGLVLLDAPPPSGRAILSDELIASVLENSKNGNRTDVLQHQLQRHARMMSRYRGTAHDSPTRLASIYVRCTEGYQAPPNVTVDEWYTKRGDAGSIVAEWKTLLDEDLIVLDVPGHHFEMFLPSRVCPSLVALVPN